jgi:hypothetical protein
MAIPNWVYAGIGGVVIGAAIAAGGWLKYSGPPSTQMRWANVEKFEARPSQSYKELVEKDPNHNNNWANPTVTVYSAPYIQPHQSAVTLKDLSDNGQAHVIDVVFKGPKPSETTWQALMKTTGLNEPAKNDPYRADRVLIATVAKGLNTLPGDRLLWTRVFVQPINFQFAGYAIAATDSKSAKIATVENTTDSKLSLSGGDFAITGVGKSEIM